MVLTVLTSLLASPLCTRAPARCPGTRAQIDGLRGIDLECKLGEGSFSEVVSGSASANVVLSGQGSASTSAVRVQVGLFYGTLSGVGVAGTRALVKAYSPYEQPPWAEESGSPSDAYPALTSESAQLLGLSADAATLETSLRSTGRSAGSLAQVA
uniref:Uncharacterized protein n=1 Tax=Coccolithus braarudii TaxID=221442 RepID=A0A6T7K1D0_9EUKA|mmetsp:Transcript_51218/g.109465  ORF Transcript_51218/g.109465 Transcript_51218/m.109465 type:complete len:155 (-) Transcript_51218:335-799(-)